MAFIKFVNLHYRDPDHQRLGQHFCNDYIKGQWPELFYANDERAGLMIQCWLDDHQYFDELPPKVR